MHIYTIILRTWVCSTPKGPEPGKGGGEGLVEAVNTTL